MLQKFRQLGLVQWFSVAGIILLAVLIVMLFKWADLGGSTWPVIGLLLAVAGLGVQLTLPFRSLFHGAPNRNVMDLTANVCTTAGAGLAILTFSDAINAAEGQPIVSGSEVFWMACVLVVVFVLTGIVSFAVRDSSQGTSRINPTSDN